MFNVSPDIIILGFLAGFVLFKLYSILGQKDDDGVDTTNLKNDNKDGILSNIVDISSMVKISEAIETASPEEINLNIRFEEEIKKIKETDPNFSLSKFLEGAKFAFEIILTSFASNDKATLKTLLNTATYKQFTSEIDKRVKNGISLELTLVALPQAEIKNIRFKDKTVSIEILYESQQINILKNKAGEIVEGSSADIDNMEDTWLFSKELNGKQNWILVNVNAE